MSQDRSSNPLRLLGNLREYGGKGDVKDYLKTEMRQNFKAIEDAFRKVGITVSTPGEVAGGITVTSGPDLVGPGTTSTSFVDSGHEVTVTSTGRPIVLILTQGALGDFSVSCGSSSTAYIRLMRGATKVYSNGLFGTTVGAYTFRIETSIVMVDVLPPVGSVTYKFQYRMGSGVGSITISNAKLVAIQL